MATKEDVKKEIEYLMVCFPNFYPVLEGEINIISVFMEKFGDVPSDKLHEAIADCTDEPGRKYAPSIGEIKYCIEQLQYKGLSDFDLEMRRRGLKPMEEVNAEGL